MQVQVQVHYLFVQSQSAYTTSLRSSWLTFFNPFACRVDFFTVLVTTGVVVEREAVYSLLVAFQLEKNFGEFLLVV